MRAFADMELETMASPEWILQHVEEQVHTILPGRILRAREAIEQRQAQACDVQPAASLQLPDVDDLAANLWWLTARPDEVDDEGTE